MATKTPQVPKSPSYFSARKLRAAKTKEFSLIDKFIHGYRNREDVTMLPPGVLIQGSQNVVTNVYGRIGTVQGYALDGASSTTIAPCLGSFDWLRHTGTTAHLKSGFLTSAGNDGKLQYRYVTTGGTVSWRDLLTGLTSTKFRFVDYWDSTNVQSLLLMVNGASSITEWTGGVTTVASVTANTITKSGTTTWAEEGFYTTGTHKVTINGSDYTATGGWGTLTLTGVTPNPTGSVNAGDIAHQTPETTLNSAMTNIPSTLTNNLIGILRNQVYIGSSTNRSVYVSKVNNYKDYSFTSPVRVVGEGALITLDACPIGFAPELTDMFISAGNNLWYATQFTLSSDLTKESFQIQLLNTAAQQGAQSQEFISKVKNNIVFLSNEPIINIFGQLKNYLSAPQMLDLSYSIINDMNSYDFTDGSICYWRNFILVAVPKHSLIRIYNQTNPKDEYWEAPVGYPISRFSIIDGNLYGHSYQTSESYKLFTGYNFNGSPIDARAIFSFNNYGSRSVNKSHNKLFVEGYISPNTTLNINEQYDLDGCASTYSTQLLGTDTQIVCIGSDDNNLGTQSFGSVPLGANIATANATSLPPKFRGIFTFPRTPYYEESPSFTSSGVDFHWELCSFGAAALPTNEGQNNITK